ncbi:LysR family transcriptional regulator [Variovorax terrae]|uniref:LysR family transcriptional regulator n=1 Tax=Variovorax terrae TaxID=2923278 RepID=A0A9X1VXV6_9BURK|nr:LysR family transcriptional regulator [Variovorax terrae]MCJ0764042.1 LysR family transcriptional regulator [Variovorax terrae]
MQSRQKLLDLQMLQMFVAAAEERSMSAAAARLGTTQSAVSQSIRHLEEYLGVVLFDRKHRPLQLTAAALTLFNRGRVLLAEGAQIRSEVLEASQGIAPEVTIGLVDSFAATCGPPFIKRMLEKTVRLAVRTGLTPYQGERLFARELDIAVTTDPFEGLDGKVDRRIYSEQFIVLTPKGTKTKLYTRDALRVLAASASLIRFNTQSHLGAQVETMLRRIGVRAAPRLEVDTADTLVAMVAAGLGWAITTPSCLAQGMLHISEISVGHLSGINASRAIYLVGRAGEHERLFEASYEAALEAVNLTLIPTLRRVAPGVAGLIEVAGSPA